MSNILNRWGITMDEMSDAILANGSLRGMILGYVAEIKLRNLLNESGRIVSAIKDDDHDRKKKGDLRIIYRDHEFKVECKSLQTAKNRRREDATFAGITQVDGSDRRVVKLPDGSEVTTTNLLTGEFDVLAVNCFTFEDKWRFAFAKNKDLPRSAYRNYTDYQRRYLLATTVQVTWPPSGIFTDDVYQLLDELIAEREQVPVPEVIMEEPGGSKSAALDPDPAAVAPQADDI